MIKKNKIPYKYERISSEIKKVVSEVVMNELLDERVLGKVEVNDVVTTHDFSHCKVYVSVFNGDEKEVLEGLKNSVGYVRHAIFDSVDIRKVPEVVFLIDKTKVNYEKVLKLLDEIKKS